MSGLLIAACELSPGQNPCLLFRVRIGPQQTFADVLPRAGHCVVWCSSTMCGSALRAAAVTLQTSHCDSGRTNARWCPHDHVRLVSCSWDTYVSSAPSVDRRLDATSSQAEDRATCRLVKALASNTHAKPDMKYLLQFHGVAKPTQCPRRLCNVCPSACSTCGCAQVPLKLSLKMTEGCNKHSAERIISDRYGCAAWSVSCSSRFRCGHKVLRCVPVLRHPLLCQNVARLLL